MKILKSLSVLTLLCCMALFTASCGGSNTQEAEHSHEQSHSHDEDHAHDEATHTHADGTTHADHEGGNTTAAHGEGARFTSAYVCPMHCEGSGSDTAGKCPACGMSYVAQADHVKDGHKHE